VSFLAKLEEACAAFIERAFAKTFPSDLEPAQIARKLVATMEARTRGEEGRLIAPSAYAVYVNPIDFDRLAEHHDYLERAWAELLRDLAAKVGVTFDEGDARVTMAPRDGVPKGAIAIESGDAVQPAPHRSLRMIKGLPPNGVYSIEGRARIGRSEESEIVLVDPSVSRSHAIVEVEGRETVVRDLGSTNGTFVNGRRIQSHALRDGDELLFGNTRMKFESA
jgi:hypothetical protein